MCQHLAINMIGIQICLYIFWLSKYENINQSVRELKDTHQKKQRYARL